MTFKMTSRSKAVLAVGLIFLSGVATAQSQEDLDKMSKSCGLPKGKFEVSGDKIILHASMKDQPKAMGCSRAEIEKMPGAIAKLMIAFDGDAKAEKK